MCEAFSCIVEKSGKVTWEFAKDSHEILVEKAGLKDDTADREKLSFARVEISPENGDYLKPDKWTLKIDENIKPTWFSDKHEKACWSAWSSWKAKLDKILIYKEGVNPFLVKRKCKYPTKQELRLLAKWISVGDSVADSVGSSVVGSVGDSVWNSVWDSVGDSVVDSVVDSVGSSVWNSVRAYMGSFFRLKRKDWKYTEKIKTKGYPFQSAVKLWERGLVTSFDGTTWRLHAGKNAEVVWSGSVKDLKAVVK